MRAEILVLRRAGSPYGAVFAGWSADSSATQNLDSPTDSWTTTAPLSFSIAQQFASSKPGVPRRRGFRRMGWKRRLVELDRLRPWRTESVGEMDVFGSLELCDLSPIENSSLRTLKRSAGHCDIARLAHACGNYN